LRSGRPSGEGVADHDVQRLHELGQRKNSTCGEQVTGTCDLAGSTTTTRSSIPPSGTTLKSGAPGGRFPGQVCRAGPARSPFGDLLVRVDERFAHGHPAVAPGGCLDLELLAERLSEP